MARLNEGCELFIASLEKAQAELDQISNRLEEEFSTRCKGGEINPMDVLARIHRVRNELAVLANECAEVLQVKQECVDAAKAHLAANCEDLARLQRRVGIEAGNDDDEALQAFKRAVEELESKLRLGAGFGGEQITRSELNNAIVQSVVT